MKVPLDTHGDETIHPGPTVHTQWRVVAFIAQNEFRFDAFACAFLHTHSVMLKANYEAFGVSGATIRSVAIDALESITPGTHILCDT